MIPIVHPELYDVHFLRGHLINVLPHLGLAGDPERSLRAPRLRPCNAASRSAVSRGIGNRFRPHVVYLIARILAEAHCRAYAVVGKMLQLIHKSVSSYSEVLVGVDNRRHDGLAG